MFVSSSSQEVSAWQLVVVRWGLMTMEGNVVVKGEMVRLAALNLAG